MSSDSNQITGIKRKRENEEENEEEMIQVDNPSKVSSKQLRKTSVRDDYFWSNRTSACEMESSPSEFVNHGLLLWNQTRQQWCGNKTPSVRTPKLRPIILGYSYETLQGINKLFHPPMPLPEMVNFLIDEWVQEGLYD